MENLTLDSIQQIVLNTEEEWEQFFKSQNNPSTNTTNPEPFVRGITKYNGKDIIGNIADQIGAEIRKGIDDSIKFIRLKEAKRENDIVYPSVRIVLDDSSKEINVKALLNGDICKRYNVKTITLCHPDQSYKRGACCYINENGERVYDIINGSYNINLTWNIEEKICNIRINVKDDGTVTLLESHGITEEELLANKEVKIGKKREAKFLHEALASQLPQSLSKSARVLVLQSSVEAYESIAQEL
ncbi:hypothetical protein JTE90_021762 [Oedothorax gibbosus]|uniref:Uncharacterized protein n=1 Tax=Oedothorax gibbosus TaxID=931172 RepID=A0AAV6TZT7_9ARAC|nr:hypothetical protein JTE90_021762 [Oedothorax gibbosus]